MSYWRTLFAFFGGGTEDVAEVRIDASTHSLQIVDYPHHEIHSGSGYDYTEVVDQAQNAVRDIQITTPAGAKWAHLTINFFCEAETEFWLWENVVINTPGTEVTPRNHNRNSGDSSMLTVKYIDNSSLANANSDTDASGATQLEHQFVGAGKKIGGNTSSREEWILKPGEDYTIRWDATDAGYVTYHIDWYEHTDKS